MSENRPAGSYDVRALAKETCGTFLTNLSEVH